MNNPADPEQHLDLSYLKQAFGLAGRTALVTGSARGMGLAIATALGRAGARVVLSDLDRAACEQAASALRAEGVDVKLACFDVADQPAVDAARQTLEAGGWEVDILVNNAGNQNRKALVDMASAEWQSLMNVHLNGSYHCTHAFLPGMCRRGFGRIVMMSSVSAQATMPLIAAYSTAKAGMAALARAVAVEYGGQGVTANSIAPGFVRTGFTTGLQQREGFEDYLRQSVPMARWAEPEEIAPVVLFLVSPAAGFVNGQHLAIDGGLMARL